MDYAKLAKEARNNVGFPFGAYRLQITRPMKVEKREGAGGKKSDYADFSVKVIEKLDPSAHAGTDTNHKISFNLDAGPQAAKWVSLIGAVKGLEFDDFQALPDDEINEWAKSLELPSFIVSRNSTPETSLIFDCICKQQDTDPAYREHLFFVKGGIPTDISLVFTHVEVPKKTTAAKDAKESATASLPPGA